MFKLHDFQTDIINEARIALRHHDSVLIQSPTGSGKTVLSADMSGSASRKKKRTFFICHRAELIDQTAITYNKVGIPYGFIAAGYRPDPFQHVQICSIDTLKARIDKIEPPDFCIWDECFPAGTKIDGVNIENLKVGDEVFSVDHDSGIIEKKPIKTIFKNRPKEMIRVSFNDGEFIDCTAGHPFYTEDKEYIEGINLKGGQYVYELQLVREPGGDIDKISKRQNENPWMDLLFSEMFKRLQVKDIISHDDKDKQKICIREDEEKQSNEFTRISSEDEGKSQENKSSSCGEGRQWQGASHSSANNVRCIIRVKDKSSNGACGSNGCESEDGQAESLQDRYSIDSIHGGDRGRWVITLFDRQTGLRCEKGFIFKRKRVEGVEVHKQTSDGRFGGVCSDGYVYNIEVEKNHNYFANGILVHNCHHIAASGWAKVHARYSMAKHVGLTATPERLDGKGLGAWFTHMVQGPSPAWLIENGFLSDYKAFAPSAPDLAGVHKRMGDYAKGELADAMDRNTITGDAISHYLRLARGKKAIVFCVNIQHSQHVAVQFRSAGIMAIHVDGKTPKPDRRAAFDGLRNGSIDVICNVDIAGEGVDVPAIEASILLRPTQSMSLHLQQVGRALRVVSGKKHAIILDHAGNLRRHGLPDEERDWSLEGNAGKKKGKKDDLEEVNIRECPKCFHVHKPMPMCPGCGHVYVIKERKLEQVDGELVEIDKEAIKRQRGKEQGQAQSLDQLIALGVKRGYKNPSTWAAHIYTAREAKRRARV